MNELMKYPPSHWASALSKIPASVVLACAANEECSAVDWSLYCLSDGDIAVAPGRSLGKPSFVPVISTLTELVGLAYARELSDCPDDAWLRMALEFPGKYGDRVFRSRRGAVVLPLPEREELTEAVIASLTSKWAEDRMGFIAFEGPEHIVDTLAESAVRVGDLSPDFVELCARQLRRCVLQDLEHLLADADARCEEIME